MAYILCRDAEAEHPYYVKELAINLYSAYELCYFIYNHSPLLTDEFPDEEMLRFIGTGCHMPELERKLRKWKADGEEPEILMLAVLQDVNYYGEREMRRFQDRMNRQRGLSRAEKVKQKGDYLLGRRRFSMALGLYEEVLKGDHGDITKQLSGRVKYNSGIGLANMFLFSDAANAFANAYEELGEESILRDLCFIYELDPTVPIREDLMEAVPARNRLRWKEEYQAAYEKAGHDSKVLEVRAVMEKGAFSRGEALEELTSSWKKEYRGFFK